MSSFQIASSLYLAAIFIEALIIGITIKAMLTQAIGTILDSLQPHYYKLERWCAGPSDHLQRKCFDLRYLPIPQRFEMITYRSVT